MIIEIDLQASTTQIYFVEMEITHIRNQIKKVTVPYTKQNHDYRVKMTLKRNNIKFDKVTKIKITILKELG